jgi:two-component system, OmpR family, bacitracin resistance response regulator BceR
MREGKCIDLDMNIFIVEDDIAIFDSLKERLGQWSFQVSGPTDFHEVMGTFMQEKTHLVIMDIQLPAYDGFHRCREIRAVSKSIPNRHHHCSGR